MKFRGSSYFYSSIVSGVSATGGTTFDINVGGVRYRVHVFTSTANLVVLAGGEVQALLIGGGGFKAGGGGWWRGSRRAGLSLVHGHITGAKVNCPGNELAVGSSVTFHVIQVGATVAGLKVSGVCRRALS